MRQPWRDSPAARVRCPTCDAPAGELCAGTVSDFHYSRNPGKGVA